VNLQQQRSPRGLASIDIDPKAIPPKHSYRSARYFILGEFARLCLGALGLCGRLGGQRVARKPSSKSA